MKKITSFTQLKAWQEGHKLVLKVYEAANKFPQKEKYILASQILRSAISITSNIAEGFTRKSKKEKEQFYCTAKASLTELQNQLLIARDVAYLSRDEFNNTAQQTVITVKLINGLINGISKLK